MRVFGSTGGLFSSAKPDPSYAQDLAIQQKIRQILIKAETSLGNNIRLRSAMSSPPTIVQAAKPGSATKEYRLYSDSNVNPNAPVYIQGGTPKVVYTSILRMKAATVSLNNTGWHIDGSDNASSWRVSFFFDGSDVSITLLGGASYRFIVDGQYTSLTPLAITGGLQNHNFSFSVRRITIEGWAAGGIGTIWCLPTDRAWHRNPVFELFSMAIASSSLPQQVGLIIPNVLAPIAGDFLGIDDPIFSGVGGTGYTKVNGKLTFIQRINDWVTPNPDLLILAGGHNDDDDDAFQPAVLVLLSQTHKALPNTAILLFGIWYGATGPDATKISKENKIKAALDQHIALTGDKYIKFVP